MRNKRPDGKETHDTKTKVNGAEYLVKEEDLLSDPTTPPFHRERRRAKLSSPLSCCGNNYHLFCTGERTNSGRHLNINNFGEISSAINKMKKKKTTWRCKNFAAHPRSYGAVASSNPLWRRKLSPDCRVGAITIIHARKSRRSRVSKEDIVSPLHSEPISTRAEWCEMRISSRGSLNEWKTF